MQGGVFEVEKGGLGLSQKAKPLSRSKKTTRDPLAVGEERNQVKNAFHRKTVQKRPEKRSKKEKTT